MLAGAGAFGKRSTTKVRLGPPFCMRPLEALSGLFKNCIEGLDWVAWGKGRKVLVESPNKVPLMLRL